MFARSGPRALRRHSVRAINPRAANPDRWESLMYLHKLGTPEAASALLDRFGFRVDPSITDEEEKNLAFETIVSVGSAMVGPVKRQLRVAKSIGWPIKLLSKLTDQDTVIRELCEVLGQMDTAYERDPEKKIQILAYLEDHPHDLGAKAAMGFLDDMNETARFHAMGVLKVQPGVEVDQGRLLTRLQTEDSRRVLIRCCEVFETRNWAVPESHRKAVKLPAGFTMGRNGILKSAS